MIDDNDVELVAVWWPSGGWLTAIIGLAVVIVLAVIAAQNANECAAKTCPPGQMARLLDHDCLCISEAK